MENKEPYKNSGDEKAMSKMKTTVNGINNRLDIGEGTVEQLEDITVEAIQYETHKQKRPEIKYSTTSHGAT